MFSNDPFPIQLQPNQTAMQRVTTFFAHLDSMVFISDTAYAEFGRGSLGIAGSLFYNAQEYVGCVGRVGQFCNYAKGVQLFAGGAHHNDLPVNMVFGGLPVFNQAVIRGGVTSLRTRPQVPFSIGNGVLLSADSKVMSGAEVADGVVVAANGVVTGKAEAFGIYGGVPAKLLRARFDDEVKERVAAVRWWDFDTVYLLNNISRLQELAVDTDAHHVYRKPTPKLVWRGSVDAQEVHLHGFYDGAIRPVAEAPKKVQEYVAQAIGPGPHYWLANIWDE